MGGEVLAPPDVIAGSAESKAMEEVAFRFRPSVGTWLQLPRQLHVKATARAMEPVAFRFRPSVGTWLQPVQRFNVEAVVPLDDQAKSSEALALLTAIAEAWQADFDAEFDGFVSATPVGSTAVPEAKPDSLEWSPAMASPQAAASPSSGGGVFRLAPPPKASSAYSVGSMSPPAELIVIDDLKESRKLVDESTVKVALTNEALIGVPAADDDEEELLGKADHIPSAFKEDHPPPPHSSRNFDGIDSDSEPEVEASRPKASDQRVASIPARENTPSLTGPTTGAGLMSQVIPSMATPQASREAPVGAAMEDTRKEHSGAASQASRSDAADPNRAASTESRQYALVGDQAAYGGLATDMQPTDQQPAEQEPAPSGASPPADLPQGAPAGVSRFRVRVPKPYPGIQYRRSKDLEDRYDRLAPDDSIVCGRLEDGGTWLRIADDRFLPVRIKGMELLEPLAEPLTARAARPQNRLPAAETSWWFTWCSGCRGDFTQEANEDVLVNQVDGNQPVGMNVAATM